MMKERISKPTSGHRDRSILVLGVWRSDYLKKKNFFSVCLVRLVCAFNGRPIGVCKNHRAPFSETFRDAGAPRCTFSVDRLELTRNSRGRVRHPEVD